jgi:hypothetical protein
MGLFMRQPLLLHPASPCAAVARIEVQITRPQANRLVLVYVVTGRIDDLVVPRAADPARTDELWRHTCFEAFVRRPPGAAYYEFNFAPSRQWAAYQFSGHRTGMRVATEIGDPRIEVDLGPERYILRASLKLDEVLLAASCGKREQDAAWRLGLSAVIEEAGGCQSYWALAHPQGRPDFHHSDCFALEVPEPCRP